MIEVKQLSKYYDDVEALSDVSFSIASGEVIGLLTCLTKAERMASAKARTAVCCRIVRQQDVTKSLRSLPQWIKIIIKEFWKQLKVVQS